MKKKFRKLLSEKCKDMGLTDKALDDLVEIGAEGLADDASDEDIAAKVDSLVLTVTFDNLRLVSSQTYDFVFWADCAEGSEGNFTDKVYNTANLKSITEIGPFVGNSDERDAFFAKESFKVTGSFTKPVTLKRPFGLLVVKTNDLNEIKRRGAEAHGLQCRFQGTAHDVQRPDGRSERIGRRDLYGR